MTFEVLIEHDESPCVVDAEDWEFGPHGALMFYDADRNLVEVFRNWAHMTVNRERAGFWSRTSIPNPNHLAERDRQEQKVHEAMGAPRAMLGKNDSPTVSFEGSSTETWHDPAIQALKDAWAELCDRGHNAAADAVFQMIQRRTGLEGLEYEVKREIPQTAPGKEYQPEASAESLTEEHDRWKRRMLNEGVTHDATGGNADAELFQPGWSKVEFRGGPIHGHEGLLPAGVSMMLVVRGDHSYSYSLEPQGNVMAYVGAEALNG